MAADWGGVHIQSQELMLRTSFGLAAQLLAAPGSSAALGYSFMILTCSCLAPERCGPGVTQRGRVTRASPPWMTSGGTKAKELSIAVIDKGCFLLIYYEVSRSSNK